MKRALLIVLVIVAVIAPALLVAIVLRHEEQREQQWHAHEILNEAKVAVSHLKSLEGDAFFSQSVEQDGHKERSNTRFHIKMLTNRETDESVLRIDFKDYEYESDAERDAHERMRVLLQNASLFDYGSECYVFTPKISEEQITAFSTRNALFRYKFIPLVEPLHIVSLFDLASNASYRGIVNISVGNETVKAHEISYELSYPAITFAERAELRTFISAENFLPLRTELSAIYKHNGENTRIKRCFGFLSYKVNTNLGAKDFRIAEGLRVITRD